MTSKNITKLEISSTKSIILMPQEEQKQWEWCLDMQELNF